MELGLLKFINESKVSNWSCEASFKNSLSNAFVIAFTPSSLLRSSGKTDALTVSLALPLSDRKTILPCLFFSISVEFSQIVRSVFQSSYDRPSVMSGGFL